MPEQKTLTTTVRGLGKQRSGNGWMLTLAHTWPDSKFETVLYGKDMGQVKGIAAGDAVAVLVQKGNLKSGKDPKYNTSFFWDMVSIQKGSGGQATPPSATQPAPPSPSAPSFPYAPPAPPVQDATRRSIERQKALAEGREAAVALVQSFLDHNALSEIVPWPSFRDTWATEVEELTTRFAARFYRSITGRRETRDADPDAEGNEPQ